jgi:hypothetical protein
MTFLNELGSKSTMHPMGLTVASLAVYTWINDILREGQMEKQTAMIFEAEKAAEMAERRASFEAMKRIRDNRPPEKRGDD